MALSYKDIEVDGNIFRCDGVWTVRVAREEIRDCYSLQGGGILSTETGVRVPGDVVIGTLTGALSFVGGRGTDINKSPIFFLIPVTDPNETLHVFHSLCSHTSPLSPTSR